MSEPTQHSPLRLPPSPLVFDAVGTLIYAEPTPAEAYERVGRRHGSRLSQDEIGRRFTAAFKAEEQLDRRDPELQTDDARELRRWQAIVAAVLDDVSDSAAVFTELWHDFARPDVWKPFADAVAVIPELVRRGVVVGVASNFDSRLHGIIAAHFPTIRPEHVFASSEVGFRKPGRGFFRRIEESLAGPPTLIGDDVENDLLGAQAAGWNAILIDRGNQHFNIPYSHRIHNLRELLQETSV